jgi:fructokinase
LTGANAVAGEWGHNPLPAAADDERPGPKCYCGRTGCLETFLSGPAFARDAGAPTAEDAVTRAASGDANAKAALDRYADRLARALGTVINLLDPGIVVLGGGLSNIDALYADVPARWRRYIFSDRVDTKLVKAIHGDSSGVRGAAWLWPADGVP